MKHPDRVFGVEDVCDVKTLADILSRHVCSECTGFQLGEYLFLNDSFSEDGKQVYAVLKIDDGWLIHIETVTFSNWSLNGHQLVLVLSAAMESKLNLGAYNDLQLEDAEKHTCDYCKW